MRAVFATFRMEIPLESRNEPWADNYRNVQFDLYRRISSRPDYSTENEVSGFAVDPKRPFPYYTESSVTVGDQLMAVGYIIKTMALPAGSSILEFGPGWGNTTIALAQMGYEITALDINPNFVQLIRDRAQLFGLSTGARVGAFSDAGTMEGTFDAVLFYECFHHCSDHQQLLADLHRVVKPGGHVFLAAEPIFEGFHAPWGLRLDGESLWAIRQNGWLELGFTESYFIETCVREGWAVSKHLSPASHLTVIYRLNRLGGTIAPGSTLMPFSDESGWAAPDSPDATQRYTSAHSRLVCPIGQTWTTATVNLVNPGPLDLPYKIKHGEHTVVGRMSRQSHLSVEIEYSPTAGELAIETQTWSPSRYISGSRDERLIGLGVLDISFR